MALLFAYNGSQHVGLQVQTGNATLRTIEGDLSQAICSAGGMHHNNLERLSKVNWQRTARTDKGVHAACNLISLNLVTERRDYSTYTRSAAHTHTRMLLCPTPRPPATPDIPHPSALWMWLLL